MKSKPTIEGGVSVVRALRTHFDLLDWLATEFVRTGWDAKAMQRLIVTSAAYRQSSKASPELHRRDPDNTPVVYSDRCSLKQRTERRLKKDYESAAYPITPRPILVTRDGIATG